MTQKYCPNCTSPLRTETRPYSHRGVYLGRFDFYVCPVCSRVLTPKQTALAIEEASKSKGLWGADRGTIRVLVNVVPPSINRPGLKVLGQVPDELIVDVWDDEKAVPNDPEAPTAADPDAATPPTTFVNQPTPIPC